MVATWYTPRVPKPLQNPSAASFVLGATGRKRGHALCLHGYTGTPFEVRVVADALAAEGFGCSGPLLPGHGTDPRALRTTPFSAWQDAANAAFVALPATAPRILVGCSMGALLCLRIAADRPNDVAALVLLAPALKFFAEGELAARAARGGLWRVKPAVEKEDPGGDIGDVEGRRANPTYPVLPLRGVAELSWLQDETRAILPRVQAPLLVVHGRRDHTIPPSASAEVIAGVSSTWVERVLLKESQHVIGLDVDRDTVAGLVVDFVIRVLQGRSVAGVMRENTAAGGR